MERPFFDVGVTLRVPDVCLTPALAEIQEAINNTAKRMLSTSKQLRAWGLQNGPATYYDLIAKVRAGLWCGAEEPWHKEAAAWRGAHDCAARKEGRP